MWELSSGCEMLNKGTRADFSYIPIYEWEAYLVIVYIGKKVGNNEP